MSTRSNVVSAIISKVGTTNFSIWRISLTHDLSERKQYWADIMKQNITWWASWTANSLSDAQDIEAHFISRGMKGGTGGNLSNHRTVYIYVF